MDNTPLPNQRNWGPMDRTDCHCLLDDLPGALDCRRHTAALAETAAAFDSAMGSAECPTDFYADRQSSSSPENAWKSAWLAEEQAKKPKLRYALVKKIPVAAKTA